MVASAALLGSAESRAALPVVDNCDEAAYQDRTAPDADRVLDWDFVIVGSPERCLKIAAGQSVQWVGSFATHPLGPDQGDVPNPVASHDANGVVVFPSAGLFGYRCNTHFEMRGAIQVVAAPPTAPAMTPWMGVLLAALLTILATAMLGYRSRA
jgi:plastocyanin